jgi:hypothetical protein
MSDENKQIALPVGELKPSDFMFSKKETRTWNFPDKNTPGKQLIGSYDYVEVFYGEPGKKLAFVIEHVKCISGIQTTTNTKRGFMSVSLTPEQSAMIRKAVDDPIFLLAFQNRDELFKQGRKIQQPMEMKFLFSGIVKDGKEKKDQSNNLVRGPDGKIQTWSDSITGDIAMTKVKNQVEVDKHQCQIIDLNDSPYSWTSLSSKNIRELIVQVDCVKFTDKIRVQLSFKLIVPDEKGGGARQLTTKRRLEMVVDEKHEKHEKNEKNEKNEKPAAGPTPPGITAPPPPTTTPTTSVDAQKREEKKPKTG